MSRKGVIDKIIEQDPTYYT